MAATRCRFPAQRLGLPDRGLLRHGFKADVVVFDAKMSRRRLPGPSHVRLGIDYVIVNGQVVVDSGKHTGIAGRALRSGRAST